MIQMKVKAAAGIKVPREGNPRRYITDEAVTVDDSAYYRRQIAAGDLTIVSDAVKDNAVAGEAKAAKPASKSEGNTQEVDRVQS